MAVQLEQHSLVQEELGEEFIVASPNNQLKSGTEAESERHVISASFRCKDKVRNFFTLSTTSTFTRMHEALNINKK
jgi:hypothetical protein